MMKKITVLMVILSFFIVAIFSGCIQSGNITANKTAVQEIKSSDIRISEFETTQELKKFSSISEIREYLKASASQPGGRAFAYEMGIPAAVPISASKEASGTISYPAVNEQAAVDYSKTNIQVEGVDEADFIKNDGKYIYVLAQNKLVIVDAFPAEDAKTLSETTIEGRPRDMFVNGDRLIVFTETNDRVFVYQEYDYRPIMNYAQKTGALIYDITDRKKPQQIANYSISGNYFRSRMIGDYVYLIVKDNVYHYSDIVDVPVIKQDSASLLTPDIYYFDNPEQNYVFHTLASINIKSKEIEAKSFMMGYSDNLYVSENNIYITYRKNLPFRYYEVQREERFYRIIVPQLPEDAREKIIALRNSSLEPYEKWDKISSVLEDTYNRMSEKEKQDYISRVEKAVEEYDVRLAREMEKTVIQKIGINKGDIEYKTRGEVSGSLLNQFSMDESGDYFRVATTTQLWTGKGSVQYNNVYVMDKDLNIAGKLEEIAPDERIYSTRFIGNRLYMVTFRRIDPLFVIDLSDPGAPKILGELKIPGFSDYLHPYDENHIIGVGKETGDNGWGGVSIKGVKLSLFDVSDVTEPKQLAMYEIGKAGTDSEALYDHKAFLFDREKNLLVIPIREPEEREKFDWGYGYRQKVWQGAYVFGVTPADGFSLRGKISHLDDFEEPEFYWNSPGAVRRSLYMDDVLYTVSMRKILMNSLDNTTLINSIALPFERDRYYDYAWR